MFVLFKASARFISPAQSHFNPVALRAYAQVKP